MLIVYVCTMFNLITMKDIKHLIIIPFLCSLSMVTISSQEKSHPLTSLIPVDIDTLSYLRIDKMIYYKDPLEIEYNSLTDNTFIPEWYNAFCACNNIEYFKNFPKESLKYYYKDMGYTETKQQDYYNQVKAAGGTKENLLKINARFPVSNLYIFGETWLTLKKTGDKYILVQGIRSNNKFQNLKFTQAIKEKNIKNEQTDSIKNPWNSINIYINDNDTLKLVDQGHVLRDLIGNGNGFAGGDLANFKDIMYRAPIFIQSEMVNGKRVFETMEKGKEGPIKTKESNKP